LSCTESEEEEEEETEEEKGGEESEKDENNISLFDMKNEDVEQGMVSKTLYLHLFIISYIIGRGI
jgi:hypothetical protein